MNQNFYENRWVTFRYPSLINLKTAALSANPTGDDENQFFIKKRRIFYKIRSVLIDGEPWPVSKDVAQCLGYKYAFGALKKHVGEADKQNCQNDSFETPREFL